MSKTPPESVVSAAQTAAQVADLLASAYPPAVRARGAARLAQDLLASRNASRDEEEPERWDGLS